MGIRRKAYAYNSAHYERETALPYATTRLSCCLFVDVTAASFKMHSLQSAPTDPTILQHRNVLLRKGVRFAS